MDYQEIEEIVKEINRLHDNLKELNRVYKITGTAVEYEVRVKIVNDKEMYGKRTNTNFVSLADMIQARERSFKKGQLVLTPDIGKQFLETLREYIVKKVSYLQDIVEKEMDNE